MQIRDDVATLLCEGMSDAEVSRRTGIHPVKIGDTRRALDLPSHWDMKPGYIAPPSHREHGIRAKYVMEKCRCKPCKEANRHAHAERDRLLAYGRWEPYMDAQAVYAHIRYLQACGMGLRAIAEAAGVDRKRLQAILGGRPERGTGPQEKVRPALAAAVLAVEPTLETLAPSTLVSPIGTRRRVQALVAAGWPQQHLAAFLGMHPGNFGQMLAREHVLVRRARAVIAMYEELWRADPVEHGATPVGTSRARKHAAAHGWAPVGAWDDDRLDDPDAFPDWTGQCGTPLGYEVHRRHGLMPACQPCKAARTADRQARKAVA